MVNNDLGTNIFLAGADSAQNGGILINGRRGHNLIYAGAGAGGNGGVHVNAANAANLIFIGADEQTNGTGRHLGPQWPGQRDKEVTRQAAVRITVLPPPDPLGKSKIPLAASISLP